MTAPDITGYVDLRPYDVTDQAIVETAIAATKLNLPGWVPREGNTEVLIMEALALQIAEGIVAINRLPGAVVVRAGKEGCYVASPPSSSSSDNEGVKRWLPAYHQNPEKVVDPTGGGNGSSAAADRCGKARAQSAPVAARRRVVRHGCGGRGPRRPS